MFAKRSMLCFLILILLVFLTASDLQAANPVKSFFSKFKSSPQKESLNVDTAFEADFYKLIKLIYTEKGSFPEAYSRLASIYTGEKLKAINTIYLKYLFLEGKKEEFIKVLATFPDDHVFKSELKIDGKKLPFYKESKNYTGDEGINASAEYFPGIYHSKNYSKTDLLNLWKKADELDQTFEGLMSKKEYMQLLGSVYLVSEYSFPGSGPYDVLFSNPYYWAGPLYRDRCSAGIDPPTEYWRSKNGRLLNFLSDHFGEFYKDDEKVLLKMMLIHSINFESNSLDTADKEYNGLRSAIEELLKNKNRPIAIYNFPFLSNGEILKKEQDVSAWIGEKIDFDNLVIYKAKELDNIIGVAINHSIVYFKKDQQGKWIPLIFQQTGEGYC